MTSTNFLNKFIYYNNPIKEPFMSLKSSTQFVAYFSLTTMIIIMLFIAEKHIKRASFVEVVKL